MQKLFALLFLLGLGPSACWTPSSPRPAAAVAPAPRAADLVGTWRVDLRPAPDAEPYYQTFVVSRAGDQGLEGSFYDTPIEHGNVNTEFGLHFAFVTDPGSGAYHSAGRLVNGRLEGTTHSLGRGFVSPWTAERVP